MIITRITACDHRAYLDNMQRVPSLRYTMQTTRNWTPNSVIGAGYDAPAMRSDDGRHIDCLWSPSRALMRAGAIIKIATPLQLSFRSPRCG